jgi:hypothetical protein
MSYNPDIHHRRSIRLRNDDYSLAGPDRVRLSRSPSLLLTTDIFSLYPTKGTK